MLTFISRVNMWGSKFGKELWESLTVATRRDTIQQVRMERIMISTMEVMLMIMVVRHEHCHH